MPGWIEAEQRAERAYDLFGRGLAAEAATELQAAIEINPDNASWHFNLGLVMEALSEYERACESYKHALRLDPTDLEVLSCLGVNLTRMGKCSDALSFFRRIEQIDPTYEPAYCNRIFTYTEMGDHDNAELMFYLARLFKDDCPACYYNIGGSFFARRQYERAIHCWQEALHLDSTYPQVHSCIAEACWALGQLAKAKFHYLAEIRLTGGDVETLLDLGDLLIELGELDEATEAFEKALGKAPDATGAYFGLGEIAVMQGRLKEAERLFELVLKIDPEYPCVRRRLAKFMLARGENAKAVRLMLDELSICGDDSSALTEIGKMLLRARRRRLANSVLRRAIRLRPHNALAHQYLAVSYLMMRRFDEGIRHCRRALKLKPDSLLALRSLAVAFKYLGDMPRARRYAARSLAIAPEKPSIRKLIQELSGSGVVSRLAGRFGRIRRRGIIRS